MSVRKESNSQNSCKVTYHTCGLWSGVQWRPIPILVHSYWFTCKFISYTLLPTLIFGGSVPSFLHSLHGMLSTWCCMRTSLLDLETLANEEAIAFWTSQIRASIVSFIWSSHNDKLSMSLLAFVPSNPNNIWIIIWSQTKSNSPTGNSNSVSPAG